MTTILEPGQVPKVTGEPPRVIAPARAAIFADRARRFDGLAEGHALADWLRFLARLTRAQHEALQTFPAVPLPEAVALAQAHSHAMPPLPARNWPRDPAWRSVLAALLDVAEAAAPPAGRAALGVLRVAPGDHLEALADRVLRTEFHGEHAAVLPVVAAALQVHWTHMAIALGAQRIPSLDVPGACPCCGGLPVASVVHIGGEVAGLRYLHCALCNTEWNLVRVKCAACDATEGISYRQIENGRKAVRAETCDSCRSYLKILYRNEDPDADPVADDLASLALDLLVDEAGYGRAGPNLLLTPGDGG